MGRKRTNTSDQTFQCLLPDFVLAEAFDFKLIEVIDTGHGCCNCRIVPVRFDIFGDFTDHGVRSAPNSQLLLVTHRDISCLRVFLYQVPYAAQETVCAWHALWVPPSS